MIYKKNNKNITFTILRVSNVFGGKKKSNLFRFSFFLIKLKLWIKSFDDVMFNFISVKDVARAVALSISKLRISRNKIYIISDDVKQKKLYINYLGRKNFFTVKIPISLVKFVINFIPLPKKILNLLLTISSRVTYDNQKIIDELSFTPLYSIHKKIKKI
jgi:nucleoside-diphosphate-sugar epimerase